MESMELQIINAAPVALPPVSRTSSPRSTEVVEPKPPEFHRDNTPIESAVVSSPPKSNADKMLVIGGGSERQLSGLRPRVPLRKRGQSFKETRKVTIVDYEGRRQLNQYTFLEELGRGAYGVVVKAESIDTKELFAIKTVDKKALKKVRVGRFGNALQTIKKELNIWKRIKHRHIVELREVIDSDESDELFMVSELIEGGPVLDGETQCTPLSPELTKQYFCHLIEGIDFLHENKVIHRDIKPGNLLIKRLSDEETILKIADFGVSHEMESDDDSLRQTVGTAIFMAPEMLTGESFHGKPIDVWACGITLYMFIYGHPPFTANTMPQLYTKIQNDPIEFPEKVGDRVVERPLIDLLSKILEKDPSKRYTTKDIRAHPWAWRDFQVTSVKCVTHPDGRRGSISGLPKSLSGIATIGQTLRKSIFGIRQRIVYPVLGPSVSSPHLPPINAAQAAMHASEDQEEAEATPHSDRSSSHSSRSNSLSTSPLGSSRRTSHEGEPEIEYR